MPDNSYSHSWALKKSPRVSFRWENDGKQEKAPEGIIYICIDWYKDPMTASCMYCSILWPVLSEQNCQWGQGGKMFSHFILLSNCATVLHNFCICKTNAPQDNVQIPNMHWWQKQRKIDSILTKSWQESPQDLNKDWSGVFQDVRTVLFFVF